METIFALALMRTGCSNSLDENLHRQGNENENLHRQGKVVHGQIAIMT